MESGERRAPIPGPGPALSSPPSPLSLAYLAFFAAVGVALVFLYPDSYQQDAGHHFLLSRWAWLHPEFFVGVWGRPLPTFFYAFPALIGYPAAKLFTVAVAVATAWQTWRLAADVGLKRPGLAIPILFLQPSFFLLCFDTLTEPLFALAFVTALRLHLLGRVRSGMLVASLMILIRPEGFPLGILWGLWILLDRRDSRPWWRRLPSTLLLAAGTALWWLAALAITGDPLWIRHDWPSDWVTEGGRYGVGPVWWYLESMPEITGPLLLTPFVVGLVPLLRQRKLGTVTSSFLVFFVLHSAMRALALFNEAGYPRYFVCVAPAMALIALAGWNAAADGLAGLPRGVRTSIAAGVLLLSLVFSLLYVDGWKYNRDARVIREMAAGFRDGGRPVRRLIWSQTYMGIVLDRDPFERPDFGNNRTVNLLFLRAAKPGTLVFWDRCCGTGWYGLAPGDIESAGFARIESRRVTLDGLILKRPWFGFGEPWEQEFHLFWKE